MFSVDKINKEIIRCTRCPRLLDHCQAIATVKKRAYHLETYWGKPVPGFGDPKARVWVVGLAPGAHGANRTGRYFTGDSSGNWLYKALYNVGFANQPKSTSLSDGLKLSDLYISGSARCAPPDNKPTKVELSNCFPFLEQDFKALKNIEIILTLGNIAFNSVLKLLEITPKPKFTHGAKFHVENMSLFVSFHPSQQNTNTGKLTWEMWEKVFREIRRDLKDKPLRKGELITANRSHRLDKPAPARVS